MLVRVAPPERVRDNRSGYFAVWTNDSRRRRRYKSVRHALVHVILAQVLIGTGSASEPLAWSTQAVRRNATQQSSVQFDGKRIPVLVKTDLLFVGSSLDACFLASDLAKSGKSAVLASAGSSLPHELTMCMRPWVRQEDLASAPPEMRQFLSECIRRRVGDEQLLDMMKVTEGLEDRILDSGAGLSYDLFPCGVELTADRVSAVVFACKGGLVAIEAKRVVDCTPEALVVTLAGGETKLRDSAKSGLLARYTLLCGEPTESRTLAAEGVSELVDDQVIMHGEFAEFRMRIPVTTSSLPDAEYGLEARRIAAEAGRAVRVKAPKTHFVRGGNGILIDPARHIVSGSPSRELNARACRPKGLENVWVCGPAVDVDDDIALQLVEPLAGQSLVAILGETLREKAVVLGEKKDRVSRLGSSKGKSIAGTAMFHELDPVYRTDGLISAGATRLPVVATCDLVVVGGGTSGMPAAMVAAENDVDTILIEKFGDVGGTHTVGGSAACWFGRETDFVERLDREMFRMMEKTGMPRSLGMLSCLMRAKTRVLTHCLAVGAVVDGRRLTGVVITTPDGLGVIRANLVVDATGDGDIAARAGVATEYGTRRDSMTAWFSFSRFHGAERKFRGQFDCVVDPRDPVDMTRAMITARRRGHRNANCFPQYYLIQRESRRIIGRERVTKMDTLADRRYEDLVVICKANFDLKGISDSDLSFCGYVDWSDKNHEAPIPYRALLPREFDNLMVIGKAYSIDHDTLGLARVLRDLRAMGGVAGLAAAQANLHGKDFATVDVRKLQAEIVKLGVLSEEDLKQVDGVDGSRLAPLSDAALQELVDHLSKDEMRLDEAVKVLARSDASLPLLRKAFARNPNSLELARALCFLNDHRGADRLLAELDRLIKEDQLTKIGQKIHQRPDKGYAPSAAYMLALLSRLGDKRVIPMMYRVAKGIVPGSRSFCVTHSLCYAAERLADEACLPTLQILADSPGILRLGRGPAHGDSGSILQQATPQGCATNPIGPGGPATPLACRSPPGRRLFAKMPGNTSRMMKKDLKAARREWISEAETDEEEERREKSDFLRYEDSVGRFADFHATRHTYISGIVAGGATVKTAQELARHSDPRLIIGRYSHARLHDLQGALEALPDLQPQSPATDRRALPATGTDGGDSKSPVNRQCANGEKGLETAKRGEKAKGNRDGKTADSSPNEMRRNVLKLHDLPTKKPRPARRGSKAEGTGLEPATPYGAVDFESTSSPIRIPSGLYPI